MKRTTYLLKDAYGTVKARMVQPSDDSIRLEPWMLRAINEQGWRLEAWETTDSGVQIHGWADWRRVADDMAVVLRALLAEDRTEWSDEDGEQLLAGAQSALDGYHVAQMEVSMAEHPGGSEEKPDGE